MFNNRGTYVRQLLVAGLATVGSVAEHFDDRPVQKEDTSKASNIYHIQEFCR
jgi:hypothetical protein